MLLIPPFHPSLLPAQEGELPYRPAALYEWPYRHTDRPSVRLGGGKVRAKGLDWAGGMWAGYN
jgi:hypothetical protein